MKLLLINTILICLLFTPLAHAQVTKSSLEPIHREASYASYNKNESKLVYVNRPNGFYEVVNYQNSSYELSKFQLAKSPCINFKETSKVEKAFDNNGSAQINIIFNEKGKKLLKAITSKNVGKPLAIVIHKKIIIAPIINSAINSGQLTISGDFSEEEIDKLILDIRK